MAFTRKNAASAKIVDIKKAEELLSYFVDVALATNESISELRGAGLKKLRRGMAEVESEPEGINAFIKLRDFEFSRLGYEIGSLRLMYKALNRSEFRDDYKDMLKYLKRLRKDSRVYSTSKLEQIKEARYKADYIANYTLQMTTKLKHDLIPNSTLDVDKRKQIDSYMGMSRAYEDGLFDSLMSYIEKLRKSNEIEYLKLRLRFKRE